MISVLICDDAPIVRMGLRLVLDAEPGLTVAGEATDGAQAVAATADLAPDVVLLDIQMPGMDGIEAARRIIATSSAKVLVLTTFDLDDYVHEALRAGASGFLIKDTPPEGVLTAIRSVAAGDALLSPSVTRRLLDTIALPRPVPVLGTLTDAETALLTLLARGHTNTEIAAELRLSAATVKTYVSRLLAKIGARDRVQAVILAFRHGLVR